MREIVRATSIASLLYKERLDNFETLSTWYRTDNTSVITAVLIFICKSDKKCFFQCALNQFEVLGMGGLWTAEGGKELQMIIFLANKTLMVRFFSSNFDC